MDKSVLALYFIDFLFVKVFNSFIKYRFICRIQKKILSLQIQRSDMKNFILDNWKIFTLNVGYSSHNGDWNWTHVQSPFARLYYVTDGKAHITIHGSQSQTMELVPGSIYLIPPYVEHTDSCEGVFSHYYIHVYEEPSGESLFELFDVPNRVDEKKIDRELFRTLSEQNPFLTLSEKDPKSYDNQSTLLNNLSVNRRRELFNKVESRGVLYILLSRFLRTATPKSQIGDIRINRAVGYVKEHVCDIVSVNDLANVACMSKDHFIRQFRKQLGETPNKYVMRKKIERAELLLLTTQETVKSIAYELGFSDSAYFCRVFTKIAGTSPNQYRSQNH